MKLTLKVWRQKNNKASGALQSYEVNDISPDMSFLEMFDVLNERLIEEGTERRFFVECRNFCLVGKKYFKSVSEVSP